MKTLKYIYLALIGAATLSFSSCIEEVLPGDDSMTAEQIQHSDAAQKGMLPGIASHMTSCYGNGENLCGGYPMQMYLRELFCEDFPVYSDAWNYYSFYENANSVKFLGDYIYRFHYDLIHNCNNLIENVSDDANEESRQNRGVALGYRALAYMDLARYMEYQPTGYSIDDEAKNIYKCMKLTVSIVDENTPTEKLTNNPRVPFYTMYRFIMNDLNRAESDLANYSRTNLVYPNLNVIYGLKARLWLEMATRFELMPEDLTEQKNHEGDEDGYAAIGINTVADCYTKAAEYAQKAMVGYSPMTRDQYQNPTTGFNTAAENSWLWIMRNTNTDEFQDLYYYYSYLGQIVSEPSWGMAAYGNLYRCISSRLYKAMDKNDWRRASWVSEEAAGASKIPNEYKIFNSNGEVAQVLTRLTDSEWSNLPAYANLKIRSRSMTDSEDGRIADYPLMRMEEMIFIHAEATAKLGNIPGAAKEITDFVNNHRQTEATYSCKYTATSYDEELGMDVEKEDIAAFMDAMLTQKRIEFWGEGIMMWDYKRLKRGINRAFEGTNYLPNYRLRTENGYVCPWMNIRFPVDYESKTNPAAVGSPDPSQIVKPE